MDVAVIINQRLYMKPRYMAAHVRLKSDFMQMTGQVGKQELRLHAKQVSNYTCPYETC